MSVSALRVQALDRAGVPRRPVRDAAGLRLSVHGDGFEVSVAWRDEQKSPRAPTRGDYFFKDIFLLRPVWPTSHASNKTTTPEYFEELYDFSRTYFGKRYIFVDARCGCLWRRPGPRPGGISVRNGNDAGCRPHAGLETNTGPGYRRQRRGDPRTMVQGRPRACFGGGQYRDLRHRRVGQASLSAGAGARRRRFDRSIGRCGDLEAAGGRRAVYGEEAT